MDISFIIIKPHCSILRVPFRVPLRPTGYKPAPRGQEAPSYVAMLAARTAMVKHPSFESRGTSCGCSACSAFSVFHSSISLGFMYDSLSTHARGGGAAAARTSDTCPSRCSAMKPEAILPHGGRRLVGTLAPQCRDPIMRPRSGKSCLKTPKTLNFQRSSKKTPKS